MRPWEQLLFVPGVRLDYHRDIEALTVDPRLTARYEVTTHTALKAGVGLYSQAPEYWMAMQEIGNPNLDPYHAFQTSAGVEQKVGDHVKLGAEGFYKWLYDRPVETEGNRPPRFVSEGEGRIFGGEFSAEMTPREGTFAYLAYTISRSERRDLDERWRLFDSDQTHILSVVASHDLGKGWEVGARFRLISGDPTTPVIGSTYDATSGVYAPIYGLNNSERNPMFQQLDVRVQKKWRVGPGSVALYLDLQNAYNAENQEGVSYSFDYRERRRSRVCLSCRTWASEVSYEKREVVGGAVRGPRIVGGRVRRPREGSGRDRGHPGARSSRGGGRATRRRASPAPGEAATVRWLVVAPDIEPSARLAPRGVRRDERGQRLPGLRSAAVRRGERRRAAGGRAERGVRGARGDDERRHWW